MFGTALAAPVSAEHRTRTDTALCPFHSSLPPMLLALAFASLLQVTPIFLNNGAPDDDQPMLRNSSFDPTGSTLFAYHASGSIVPIDLGSKLAQASLPMDETIYSTQVTPDGSKLILAGRLSAEVRSLPGLGLLQRVNTSVIAAQSIHVNASSSRAAVVRGYGIPTITFLDLNAGTQATTQEAPTSVAASVLIQGDFAADDTSFVTIGRRALFSFDSSTGNRIARVPLVGGNRVITQMALTEDRTRVFVLVDDESGPNDEMVIEEYAAPSFQLLSTIHTGVGPFAVGRDPWFSLDAAGTRATFQLESGAFAINLLTGTTTPLATGPLAGSLLSSDGTVALVMRDGVNELVDPGTGQTLGARLLSGRRRDTAKRYPSNPGFVMSYYDSDRLDFAELTPAGNAAFTEANSGFGDEVDGTKGLTFLHNSSKAVALESDSDGMVFLETESPSLIGRLGLEREPHAIVETSSGELAVIHRRGASLVMVDPETRAVLRRMDLPAPASVLELVPGTDLLWVNVKDRAQRELLLIDTATLVIQRSLVLPGSPPGAEYSPDARFDLVNDRVATLDAKAGILRVVDLNSGSILGIGSFPPSADAAVFIGPSDERFTVVSTSIGVTSFELAPGGLLPSWSYECDPNVDLAVLETHAYLSPDRRRLLVGREHRPQFSNCPESLTLDTETGAVLATGNPFFSRFIPSNLMPDAEQFAARNPGNPADGTGIYHLKFNGMGFLPVHVIRTPRVTRAREFARSQANGRTLALGLAARSPSAALEDVALFVDPLFGRRSTDCSQATPNATGAPATLTLDGGGLEGGSLTATVSGLAPGGMLGYLITGSQLTSPMSATGSVGSICIGGETGRYVHQAQTANAGGVQRYRVELDSLPLSIGPFAAQAGSTWAFQSWYRDQTSSGTPTSNFSNAVSARVL